uniref:Uncharacterized protein n=1 Tax=Chromera velia CCMP2878 TaxID=1169474 RepID=A0A0G4FPE7_9ALVE|mmetsp:Transcript_16573/g.33722  ORF Transcript_16573/g.33722 Transcript_16573/m.33722 type:complete len:341 (+) Transcript_16573:158-1180(+)|eukprot:Cvel_17923.t1-p1 / transcript=Cvel_17923.t1 / gene=Cvel_17923 / organism=Chromera_velia_CCMP2878 / gene_product=hypothetical protein / transcript_product=hypothetical protein / location=Cvel_scaffold1456:13889-17675(+) / protein_length=340 / sequence_SO=supercontig / SO=protein_coding / is_pseudo=false
MAERQGAPRLSAVIFFLCLVVSRAFNPSSFLRGSSPSSSSLVPSPCLPPSTRHESLLNRVAGDARDGAGVVKQGQVARRRRGASLLMQVKVKAQGQGGGGILLSVCAYGPDCCQRVEKSLGGPDVLLENAKAIAESVPGVTVKGCACLGQCEKGPNLSVKLAGTLKKEVVNAVIEPEQVANILVRRCEKAVDKDVVRAVRLKTDAGVLWKRGDEKSLKESEGKLTEALSILEKKDGKRAKAQVYANRAGVRMGLGNLEGAEEDINASFSQGCEMRQPFERAGDLMKLKGDERSAQGLYSDAANLDSQRRVFVEKSTKTAVGQKTLFGLGPEKKYTPYDPA